MSQYKVRASFKTMIITLLLSDRSKSVHKKIILKFKNKQAFKT